MGFLSSLRNGFAIILILLLVSLTLSCSPGDNKRTKAIKTTTALSDARQKQLMEYARQGDVLAAIALDRSIAHITVSQRPRLFRNERSYWFEPQTANFVIDQLGHRGDRSTTVVTHKKDSLILKDYMWGGGFSPGRTMTQTKISNTTLEFIRMNYSFSTRFADLFGEGADAFRKLPSYASAKSNQEFLAYFYDPTYMGGVASDYSYGPKKNVIFAGRKAYKVMIGPSKSYKLKLGLGLEEDYIGRSYIEVYFDKRTGLPLKVDKFFDNDRFFYSTTATLDLKEVKKTPFISASEDRTFKKRYHRRLLLVDELKKYDLPTLGTSFKGYICQPVMLEGTNTTSSMASLSYQKGSDGFAIDVAGQGRSGSARDDFIGRIKGTSEEKTLVARSKSGLTGADVHKDPIPEPKTEKVKVAGADATLYSYVGLFALQMKIGDKSVFIRDIDGFHDGFSLSRKMLLEIASELVRE